MMVKPLLFTMMATHNNIMASTNNLFIMTYNMHGFFQGSVVLDDLFNNNSVCPDIILLQEHWLTPANLHLLGDKFTTHFPVGKSAMSDFMSQGPLVGRPYGGTSILIKNELRSIAESVFCADRYVIVRINKVLIANVYLPCAGTPDRLCIVEEILHEIWSWRVKYTYCSFIIGGDFNTNLGLKGNISECVQKFLDSLSMIRCDLMFPSRIRNTYVNESLGQSSLIDYFLCDVIDDVIDYCVIDPDINLSDHLPVTIRFRMVLPTSSSPKETANSSRVKQLRWDHGDLFSYYNTTMNMLYPLFEDITRFESNLVNLNNIECQRYIDSAYDSLVNVLQLVSELFIPTQYKNYYKFWWSQELSCLKDAAIESERVWKAAGRPRTGPIADKRNADKRNYKKVLRKERQIETMSYTNDLHEALMKKSGLTFWKCWNSKFERHNRTNNLFNGLTSDVEVAESFAEYFQRTCSNFNVEQNTRLCSIYNDRRYNYTGDPLLDEYHIDAELVETVCCEMKRGKAAGLDDLTIEHIINSHPVLITILAKLFNLIISSGCIPYGFRISYTVPLPKDESDPNKNSIENYRAISISPVVSKIFEHCILARYKVFLATSPNQFGFKKGFGCGHAIYSVRKVIDYYVAGGSTVNVCLLDLSKAFDKMSHSALYIKLMDRSLPVSILTVLENWFSTCLSCVKWGSVFSRFYQLKTGVRQGGVLSPFLFGVFIDDLVKLVDKAGIGCRIAALCVGIFLYADDIILLAPSIHALQIIVNICESELSFIDMAINVKKSACLRFGPRYRNFCDNVMTAANKAVDWLETARYLGVFLVSSFKFKCSFDSNKGKFYKAFNGVYGKIGRLASEEVLFQIIKSKCLPILYYGIEVCPFNSASKHSLDFVIKRIIFKIFGVMSANDSVEICKFFGILSTEETVEFRHKRFVASYSVADNVVCQMLSGK